MASKQMNIKKGLTAKEAQKRLLKFGENKLVKKKGFKKLKVLIQQLKSPLIYILILAAIITAALGEWTDALVISLAVTLNTILGFYQEYKAEQSLEALKQVLDPKAKVLRDGQWQIIEANKLVPGDVVRLELGGRVPADGLIIEADSLSLNEAILTGESESVKKSAYGKWQMANDNYEKAEDKCKVFMGTTVAVGIGVMLVEKTGMQTEMGNIAKSLKETKEEETPLQKQVGRLSKVIALVVGFITIILFIVGVLEGGDWLEMFETAVAVAVAAIPEGLAVSLTAILALGMQRILKQKAVVRKLVAAETLGATTIICCDKTGTLTEGKMRVVKAVTPDMDLLVKTAVLCNDMRDPLEISMMNWAEKKTQAQDLQTQNPRLDEIPFGPEHKYIATLHKNEKGNLLLISGAPEVILEKSQMKKEDKEKWLKEFKSYGEKGLRLVGFAHKQINHKLSTINHKQIEDLVWLGILLYEDPVRAGVAEALKKAKQAGIQIKVITGDYRETAIAVINKLKLVKGGVRSSQVIAGKDLEKMSQEDLVKKIDQLVLFVRTNPIQKLKIVQVLQEKGEVVAMTGDGVNDAPALKRADIGIVVESASDVSKQAAEIVLLDSNFTTILAAVREGRKIWENIRKVVTYLLADSFTEVVLIGGALLLRLPLPILATQILWINLVEDGLPGLALVFEKGSRGVMQEKPRSKNEPILNLEMKTLIFFIGLVTDLFLFGLFYWLLQSDLPLIEIRTFIFTALGIDSLLYIFSCKSLKRNLWHINLFSNKALLAAVAIGFVMLFAAVYLPALQTLLKTVPLSFLEISILFGLGLVEVSLVELTKFFFLRR